MQMKMIDVYLELRWYVNTFGEMNVRMGEYAFINIISLFYLWKHIFPFGIILSVTPSLYVGAGYHLSIYKILQCKKLYLKYVKSYRVRNRGRLQQNSIIIILP